MQISSVFSGFSDPAAFGLRNEAADSIGESAAPKASPTAVGGDSTAEIREILADYDLADISPRQLSEMLQRLHKIGALTDDQLQQLSLIRLDLDAQGTSSDEPIDLLGYYTSRLSRFEQDLQDGRMASSASAEPRLDVMRDWVAWLEKCQMIRSAPDESGFSAMA